MHVSFTGHRPNKIGGFSIPNPTYTSICDRLEKLLIELRPEKAISGMALGIDQWAADICYKLGIPVIAAVPFIGQEKIWPEASKKVYNELLQKASEVVIVSEGGYAAYKMQVRNEWMVDRCDTLIAIWDGTPGGTGNCVAYAEKMNKPIRRIIP